MTNLIPILLTPTLFTSAVFTTSPPRPPSSNPSLLAMLLLGGGGILVLNKSCNGTLEFFSKCSSILQIFERKKTSKYPIKYLMSKRRDFRRGGEGGGSVPNQFTTKMSIDDHICNIWQILENSSCFYFLGKRNCAIFPYL